MICVIKNDNDLNFVHESMVTSKLKNLIEKISKTESFVLLSGPPGSGKEVVARLIHKQSNRSKNLFRIINCNLRL